MKNKYIELIEKLEEFENYAFKIFDIELKQLKKLDRDNFPSYSSVESDEDGFTFNYNICQYHKEYGQGSVFVPIDDVIKLMENKH